MTTNSDSNKANLACKGTFFDDFLKDEGIFEEVDARAKATVSAIRQARLATEKSGATGATAIGEPVVADYARDDSGAAESVNIGPTTSVGPAHDLGNETGAGAVEATETIKR